MLFAAQGSDKVNLHFTKEIGKIDAKRKAEKNKKAQKNKGKGKPFEFWDDNRDSLAALLDREKLNGRNFETVEPDDRTGIRIHLLTPLDIPRHGS